jgi:hypothetical protein
MSDEEQAETVKKFEQTLNELKKPYLNATELDPSVEESDPNAGQDMSILTHLEKELDSLHGGVKELIEANGVAQEGGGLDKHALYQLFERKGIFTSLKNNPELKPLLLQSLHLMLKEYPFTRSIQHIYKLKGTPSYQIEIIPNKV